MQSSHLVRTLGIASTVAPVTLAFLFLASGHLRCQPPGAQQPQAPGETKAPDPAEPSRSDLEARVRELELRMGLAGGTTTNLAPQDNKQPQDPHAAMREASHSTPRGFWPIPGTSFAMNIGGYVKVDAIHDFQAIGNSNKFATQTIPVPTDAESRTNIFARESRLHVDVRGQAGEHDVRVFVEGDFFGAASTFNLRHAFGQIGGLLVGQTWTTYMDLSSRPHTLDFEGPDAELFVRQSMVRYTRPIDGVGSFSVAVEQASQDISTSGGFGGMSSTPLPDLTANFRLEGEHHHAQLSGVLRYLDFDGNAGTPDGDTIGWGIALSGKAQLGDPGRRLMGQVSVGEGSAQYNQALRGSGSDAILEATGLEALPVATGVIGYEHDWCPRWTSTAAYSVARVDTRSSQAPSATEQSQSASVNLCWHPYPQFLTGVEYLWGERQILDGQDGDAHRIQFSFKFTF